jgi:hypothetical protein
VIARRAGVEGEVWLVAGHNRHQNTDVGGEVVNGGVRLGWASSCEMRLWGASGRW